MTTQNGSKKFCVYRHIFPNNKVYIGITSQELSLRWRSDGSGYRPQKGRHSTKIWNAIQKYGWSNVNHEVLFDGLSKEQAEQKEIELISYYNSTDDNCGYNISIGGDAPSLTPEIREKISLSRRGKNYGYTGVLAPMYGKHHSDSTKEKISKATKGENNPFYGKHHTEDSKQRQREARKDRSKSVIQKNLYGDIVGEFQSIHCASQCTGVNRRCISFCVQGKYKTAGGFVWELNYADKV